MFVDESGPRVSDDELRRVVDQAREDVSAATATMSTILRNVGIGLSLLLYTLVIGKDEGKLLTQYGRPIIAASLAGILCLLADGLQYLFLWRRKLKLIRHLRAALDQGRNVSVAFIEATDASWFRTLASLMFVTKALLAFVGIGIVVYVLADKLAQASPL
jgi:hypothetical protein